MKNRIRSLVFVLSFFVFSSSFSFADTSQVIIVETPTVDSMEHPNNREIVNVNGHFRGVDFLDKDKNVKMHLMTEVNSPTNGHVKGQDIRKLLNYYLVTKYDHQYVPDEVFKKTGREVVNSNDIFVYNSNGDLIFQKNGVCNSLDAISANGKFVACVLEAPVWDESDVVDNSVLKNPPMAEIYIYSTTDGKLVYDKTEKNIVVGRTRLSPSGRWLAYCSGGKNPVTIVDLKSGLRYLIPRKLSKGPTDLIPEDFKEITDDGSLIGYKQTFNRVGNGSNFQKNIEKIILYKISR